MYVRMSHCRRVEELKIAHQQEQEEVRSRHRSELRNKEERLGAERQAWEENLLKSQSADMMTREREMKTKLREERDKVCTYGHLKKAYNS